MHKTSCTKLTLLNLFFEKADARGMRGKTKPLCASVIEQVHPDATSNWDLMTSEVEAHQRIEVVLLIQEMQAEFTCSDIAPAQFI